MAEAGAVFYRGPSLLTGDAIVGVLTGLEGGSHNPKTGPMVQAWIIRSDVAPMAAVRANVDDAICGDCKYRGRDGFDRRCFVSPWLGPNNVFKRLDEYIEASWDEMAALVEGRHVRLGAYGDPAAIPFDVWRRLLVTVSGWTGYTHQWRRCDPRLKTIVMASVDTLDEFHDAHVLGWRTFRVRAKADPLLADAEVICPASDEGQHRATCLTCELCRGQANPARSVVIIAHGNNGVKAAWHKSRRAAMEHA
jgi:hypothetical protein